MWIVGIKFTQGSEGAEPSEITATMTLPEALAIAKLVGDISDTEAEKRKIPFAFHGVYDALVSDVFNRYWEDGVDGAGRSRND